MNTQGKASNAVATVMATAEEKRVHHQILNRMGGVEKGISTVHALQSAQNAAQRPISMLHGIPPPYFYGDEGEDVEAFIYALVNCANANDWKDHKTVNNLAHFLDGRAGYAFRAAVEHRVERAKGSQKELLEERRKAKEQLTALEAEKTQAGDEARKLASRLADLSQVKSEGKEDSADEDEAEQSEEYQKVDKAYRAAMELFSVASVNYAQAKKAARDNAWALDSTEAGAADSTESSDHTIAFPTLESALKWLRVTFRREDVEDRLTGEYFGRRQGRHEKVQDFALELLKLCSRAGIVATESKKTKHFVDGLRPRLKKTLKHFILAGRIKVNDGNWEETVKEASTLEREHPLLGTAYADDYEKRAEVNAMGQGIDESVTTPAPPPCPVPTFDWGEFASNVSSLAEAAKAVEGPGKEHNNRMRSLRCYNCHELGHMSWESKQPDSRNTQAYRQAHPAPKQFAAVCYVCNKPGHYASSCPDRPSMRGGGRGSAAAPQRSGSNQRGQSNRNATGRQQMQGNENRA